MEGQDKDLGWEDVGLQHGQSQGSGSVGGGGGSFSTAVGQMDGTMGQGPMSDAVTKAMVSHFARELTQGSLSLWPQFLQSARWYFNVTHGYVLRKVVWQIVPLNQTKKKASEGELGGDKDWTMRLSEGLELDIEEPDMYIPSMSFVTYVLLCGLIRGLQDSFHPDVLSTTVTFAMVVLCLETTIFKAALFMIGAVNSPAIDIGVLLGYKFLYLSFAIIIGLLLGRGNRPEGALYHLLILGLVGSCGVAMWQALRRLARMQPGHAQDKHQIFIKVLPVLQVLFIWCLLPSWPKRSAVEVIAATTRTTLTSTAAKAVAAAAAATAGNATGAS